MVLFLTVPAKDKPAAQATARLAGDLPQAWLRKQPRPAARAGAQHAPHLQHALLSTILLVPAVLLFPKNPEVMELFNQGVGTASHTGQGVAKLRVMNKLPVVESGHTVQVETVQANDVAVVALEYQDRTSDVCARYAGDVSIICCDEVQSY